MEYSRESSKEKIKEKNPFRRCEVECPECIGVGVVYNGKDYTSCPKCKGNGMIKIIKDE